MDAESQASECTSHTHSALTVYIFLVGEVITSHKSILFRTTSNDIGEKASQIVPERPVLHGCNLKFSAVSYKAHPFDPNLIFYSFWANPACFRTTDSRP